MTAHNNPMLFLTIVIYIGLPDGVTAKSWGAVFDCSLCKTTLNSPEQLEQHRQGMRSYYK